MVTISAESEAKPENTIRCEFGEREVTGIFVSPKDTLCVSPPLTQTGRIPFRLRISANNFVAESVYTSCELPSFIGLAVSSCTFNVLCGVTLRRSTLRKCYLFLCSIIHKLI